MPDLNPIISPISGAAVSRILARMRDDVCTIQQPMSGLDATGAPVSGYATVAVESCRVIALGQQPVESVGGGRFGAVVDYEVRFSPEVIISSNDQILVNDRVLQVISDRDAISHGFEVRVQAKGVES